MEEDSDYLSFKVVFDNQVLLLAYDKSFGDFKNQTIDSLIQEVLNRVGPIPLTKQTKDFALHCPCGKTLKHNIPLLTQKCDHSSQEDNAKEKNKNEAYLLIEKEDIKEENDQLSKQEFEEKIKKALNKKKIRPEVSKEIIKKSHNSQMPMFSISINLRSKINKFIEKEERGKKIIERGYTIYYKNEFYEKLLEMGINKNKAKAGLRLMNNNNGEAAILCTEDRINWENVVYLFYDNEEVLTKEKFEELCIEEIKKEYPFIKDKEEIIRRFNYIMNILGYKKDTQSINKIISENYNEEKEE